jgi:hypothetical protein
MFKRIVLLTLFFALFSQVNVIMVKAASPTPSPSPKASPKVSPSPAPSPAASDEATTQKLKERIDRVIEERREQIQGAVDNLSLKKRGFIGEVQRVTEKTITIKNKKGSHILTIEPNVVLMRESKKISIDDVAIGDWAIAMGYVNENEFDLRRVVVSSTPLRPRSYDTIIGSLESTTKTQVTVLPRQGNQPVTFTINKNTKFEDNQGKEIAREKAQTETQHLLIGYSEKDQKIATIVRSLVPVSEKNGQ